MDFGLLLRIIIEIPLALILFFVGGMWFWQAVKATGYMKACFQDEPFLDKFFDSINSEAPFSERTAFMEPIQGNWALNMLTVMKANTGALSAMRWVTLILSLAIIGGSYFLGLPFFAINLALFLFWALPGPLDGAVRNALQDILSTAQIAYRWKQDDPEGYSDFLKQAWSLEKLDAALSRHAT